MYFFQSFDPTGVLSAGPGEVEVSLHPLAKDHEAYSLALTPASIKLTAGGLPGLHYGLCTLLQLLWLYRGRSLPQVVIRDRPRFSVRGILLGKEQCSGSARIQNYLVSRIWILHFLHQT